MGWLGVDLFFVLSGFLITGILLETRESGGAFRNFYGRRALRILPLFYLVVAAAVIAVPIAYKLAPFRSAVVGELIERLWSNQVWLWTYTQNFLQASKPHQLPGLGHLWSLAIEEQFYLVWPLVVFGIARQRLLRIALATCVVITVLRFVLVADGADPWAIRHWTFTRADTLMLGGVAAIVVRDARLRAQVSRFLSPVIAGSAIFIAVSSIVVGGIATETPFVVTVVFPVSALCFAAVMIKLCEHSAPGRLRGGLEGPWLGVLGFYSYAVYLFHWPIALVVRRFWAQAGVDSHLNATGTTIFMSVLNLLTVSALSLLAAWLSWRFWERQWLRLKARFAYHGEQELIRRGY